MVELELCQPAESLTGAWPARAPKRCAAKLCTGTSRHQPFAFVLGPIRGTVSHGMQACLHIPNAVDFPGTVQEDLIRGMCNQ